MMDLLRKSITVAKWIMAGSATTLLLIVLLFLLMQTGPAKRKLSSVLAGALSSRTGLRIELSGLEGFIPFDIRLVRLTAADESGDLVSVGDFRLRWNVFPLLSSRFEIEELSASTVVLERLPSSGQDSSGAVSEKSPAGFELPGLYVRSFRVDRFTVGETLLGERAEFALAGWYSGVPARPRETAFLTVTRLDEPGPQARVVLGFQGSGTDFSTAKIDLSLENIEGSPDGGIDCESAIEVDLERFFEDGTVSAAAAGRVTGLPGLHPAVDTLTRPRIDFEGRIVYLKSGELSLPEMVISAQSARLSLEGTVNAAHDTFACQWQVTVPQIAVLSEALGRELGGTLEMEGETRGSRSNLETTVRFAAESLRVGNTRFDSLSGKIRSIDLPTAPAGEFDLTGSLEHNAFRASSGFLFRNGHLVLSGFSLEGLASVLSGELDIGTNPFSLEGNVRGDLQDISNIGSVLGEKLAGSLTFETGISNRNGQHTLSLDLRGEDLEGRPGRIDTVDVHAYLEDVFALRSLSSLRGRVRTQCEGISAGDYRLSSLVLSAAGGSGRIDFEAGLAGSPGTADELEMELAGSFMGTPKEGRLSLDRLVVRSGGHLLTLSGPAALSSSERGYLLEGFTFEMEDARIDLAGSLEPDSVYLRARIVGFPIEFRQFTKLTDMSALLDGTLLVSGRPAEPRIDGSLLLGEFRSGRSPAAGLEATSISMTGDLEKGALRAELAMKDYDTEHFRLSLAFPLDLSILPFALSIPPEGALQGKLEIDEKMERFTSLVPLAGQKITGSINGEMHIAGTVSSPEFSASVAVSHGTYENVLSGTVLKDLEARIGTDGRKIQIESFEATDGDQGTVSGKGWIDVLGSAGFPFELALSVERAMLLSMDEATALTSGTLKMEGTPLAARLSGDLTIHSADVFLPGEMTTAIRELRVVEIDSLGVPIPALKDTTGSHGSLLALDLEITMPGAVFVRGRGLDSEWKGKVEVTGRTDELKLAGTLSVVRGRFDFFGKRLRLEEGDINFTGATPPSPDVNITATTSVDELDIILLVWGTSSNLRITLSSVPELPEEEILARLLFGRELTRISTIQALQLAQAARTLSGGGGTGDFLGQTRKFLSLDELDVRQSEEAGGKTNVGAGKYLSDAVYLKVEKSLGSDSGRVMVEVEVTPNLSVESDVGLDSRTGLGVNWKHTY